MYVKKRQGAFSYEDDPHGIRSMSAKPYARPSLYAYARAVLFPRSLEDERQDEAGTVEEQKQATSSPVVQRFLEKICQPLEGISYAELETAFTALHPDLTPEIYFRLQDACENLQGEFEEELLPQINAKKTVGFEQRKGAFATLL